MVRDMDTDREGAPSSAAAPATALEPWLQQRPGVRLTVSPLYHHWYPAATGACTGAAGQEIVIVDGGRSGARHALTARLGRRRPGHTLAASTACLQLVSRPLLLCLPQPKPQPLPRQAGIIIDHCRPPLPGRFCCLLLPAGRLEGTHKGTSVGPAADAMPQQSSKGEGSYQCNA